MYVQYAYFSGKSSLIISSTSSLLTATSPVKEEEREGGREGEGEGEGGRERGRKGGGELIQHSIHCMHIK